MKDDLGDRMKDYYESRSKTRLIRRMPVIIRLDGKAFHTFTKGFEKPFDMVRAMQETMKYLCENIQGCVLGYTQSDEITLVLIDYQNLNSDAWFDYEVQKLCSVSASMATFAFNRNFARLAALEPEKKTKQTNAYTEVASKGAFFDARCFNIPKEEVTNCLLWRQQDATRNSIHMTGRAYFSHKQIEGLNSNDLPTTLKRGSCCIKKYRQTMNQTLRGYWCIDDEIPIFKDEGRDYIEKLL